MEPQEQEPEAPAFGEEYDEAPKASVDDANFDAEEENPKQVAE